MTALPVGTVTFFFSDIEGSTRLLEAQGERFADLLARHARIVRVALASHSGVEVSTEGDSFFAAFASAEDAAGAAVAVQRALAGEAWPEGAVVRVRIGLHTGEARIADGTYIGLDVNRAARIMAAGHGGQILISEATRALIDRHVDTFELRDLGEHRLRDLSSPERLTQVVADGLPADFPPLRTLDVTPNNLPTQLTELVGRTAELRDIREQLVSDGVRLVTLIGPGGIGKTRLAVQAAAELVHAFRDGIFFVDLAAARGEGEFLDAIVRVLGVTVPPKGDLHATLEEHLQPRSVMLVLDNFEQVMSAAEEVAHLLSRCPRMKVMVTSREGLRLRGERLVPIEPLSLPSGDRGRLNAADASRFEAVRLFVDRAQQVRPDFTLTDENATSVAEICARLDGLPLAIELAAANLKLFSIEELRVRLERQLELRGGPRDLPARQQTLRSTIEWSDELLDDEERTLFKVLSVFETARFEAVEAVALGLPQLAATNVIDRVAALVDKSLIRAEPHPSGQRLVMLATIRQYAAERLSSDSELAEAARAAHARFYGALAVGARERSHGPTDGESRQDLSPELGNLQAAWRHYLDVADLSGLNSLVNALWPLYDARGWYHAAVDLTNDLLDVLARAQPSAERADDEVTVRLSLARGVLAIRGYGPEVEALYRDALAISERGGALPKRLPVLRSLATFYLLRGEIEKGAATGRQILELAEQTQDPSLRIEADLIMGPATAFMGDMDAGLERLEHTIALAEQGLHRPAPFRLGPSPGVAAAAVAGLLYWWIGRTETAARRATKALELAERFGHPYSAAYAFHHVAVLDLWRRDPEGALRRAEQVAEIAEEHDYPIWKALGLVIHGVARARLGDPGIGLTRTTEGLARYEELQTPPIFWPLLLGFQAEVCGLTGRLRDAVDLLDQALALTGGDVWPSPLFSLQKADALLELGEFEAAEASLRQASSVARLMRSPIVALRAETRLARLASGAARSEAVVGLRELADSLTEGRGTLDLLEAQAELARVAEESPGVAGTPLTLDGRREVERP